MEIRRRAGLMGLVAIASALVAGGYLWRFSVTPSGVDLLIAVALGLLTAYHTSAWLTSRAPVLVVDQTGLRIRLGGRWIGVPWAEVERVELDGCGRVSDGHVTVIPADERKILREATLRSRLAAASNRWLYDAALVAPFGLTTRVSVADMPAALESLADGRAAIALAGKAEAPEPTVEITSSSLSDAGVTSESAGEAEPETAPETTSPRVPAVRLSTAPMARVVAALRSRPARRAEVIVPVPSPAAHIGAIAPRPDVRQPVTMGMLALSASQPLDDAVSDDLPEVAQLRRRDADEQQGLNDGSRNVALIIDATTDLSARAMNKVRRPMPAQTSDAVATPTKSRPTAPTRSAPTQSERIESDAREAGALIGRTLIEAREHLGLSVDELADRTRIRPYVIESLEGDDFSPCGGDFYARGHLRMLARVLGIDAEALLTTYDDHFATSPISAREVFDVELASGTSGLVRDRDSGAKWGALVAAVLVLLLIWGVARFFTTGPTNSAVGSAPPQHSTVLSSLDVPSRRVGMSTELSFQLTAVGAPSRVVVMDRYRHVVFQGVVAHGATKTVKGIAPLSVSAANGGSISLTVHGEKLGPMGTPGTAAQKELVGGTH
ncbi:MAG: RodZ domain-containing protein [Nocardioidaceae bacterium]